MNEALRLQHSELFALGPDATRVVRRIEGGDSGRRAPVDDILRIVLHALCITSGPRLVVEIGTGSGSKAIWMGEALRRVGGSLLTIESDPWVAAEAEENIREAGLEDSVTVVVGDGASVTRSASEPIGLLLLDAAKEQYLDYLDAAWERLRPGSIIVAHNVFFEAWPPAGWWTQRKRRHQHAQFVHRLATDDRLRTTVLEGRQPVAVAMVVDP